MTELGTQTATMLILVGFPRERGEPSVEAPYNFQPAPSSRESAAVPQAETTVQGSGGSQSVISRTPAQGVQAATNDMPVVQEHDAGMMPRVQSQGKGRGIRSAVGMDGRGVRG